MLQSGSNRKERERERMRMLGVRNKYMNYKEAVINNNYWTFNSLFEYIFLLEIIKKVTSLYTTIYECIFLIVHIYYAYFLLIVVVIVFVVVVTVFALYSLCVMCPSLFV
jgi:hypothetical protein